MPLSLLQLTVTDGQKKKPLAWARASALAKKLGYHEIQNMYLNTMNPINKTKKITLKA